MPSRYAEILINKAARVVSVILLAGVVSLGAGTAAHAVQVNDFQGPYEIPNWTTNAPSGGSVIPNVAVPVDEIVITEPDVLSAELSFTISAAGPGTFSFDWVVASVFDGGQINFFASSDPTPTATIDIGPSSISVSGPASGICGPTSCSGSFSASVDHLDTIGWVVANTESEGPIQWTITNFSAPAAIPVPPALLLFVSALVTLFGVGRVRRQRAADTA